MFRTLIRSGNLPDDSQFSEFRIVCRQAIRAGIPDSRKFRAHGAGWYSLLRDSSLKDQTVFESGAEASQIERL